jgi:cysteine desulfurase
VNRDPVYLDFAATTPIDPRVVEAMNACFTRDGAFANPASIHMAGRKSAAVVDAARQDLADLLGTRRDQLVWTSGATESDNLAIRGAALARAHRGKHLITLPTEHKAVADTFRSLAQEGFDVTWLSPDSSGIVSPDLFADAIRQETQLVSVMHVNNETGVIQDIRAIGEICRSRGVLFHTDAAQSVGKLDLSLEDLPVDLLSLTAHKFYGPQGIGALYIADRPHCRIFPIMFGGGQEKRLRPGTLPVHLIAGAGAAAVIAAREKGDNLRHVTALRDRLWAGVSGIDGVHRNGPAEGAYPGILNIGVDGVEGESLMLGLEPVCVASGSACNSTSGEPSHVLRSLGRSDVEAQSAVRFSFGRSTTETDIDFAIERYRQSVEHCRSMSPVT